VPKPVDLLLPVLPAGSTNTAEATLQNYTNAWSTLSQMVQAAAAVRDAAGNALPGGSLRLASASARTVSLDETFSPPIVFGYLGFDCAIAEGGELGAPIPTQATLDRSYAVNQFAEFRKHWTQSTNSFGTIETTYGAATPPEREVIRNKAAELGLITGTVDDQNFIRILRRAVDANDPEVTRKFQTLAEFCAATP
jgi:hypothetical protein